MDQTTFVTDLNKTPLIKVITWYLLAASVLSVFARAFTKAAVIHTSTLDDYLVPISLVYPQPTPLLSFPLGKSDPNGAP